MADNASYVPEQLRQKAKLYEDRNRLYGDNYKRFGKAFMALFPEGVTIANEDDANRLGVFVQTFAKFTRYASMFTRGGHDDSLDDITVYSMMLKELDKEIRSRKNADPAY